MAPGHSEFKASNSQAHLDSRMVSDAIPRITQGGVERGELPSLFHESGAAILGEDDRIYRLVESVLDWLGHANASTADKQRAFGNNLIDIARNHLEGNMCVGDMVRFVPKELGHVARKFLVYPTSADRSLQAFPNAFHINHGSVPVPQCILEPAWELMSELLMSALPTHAEMPAYAVAVEVLIYPTCSLDVSRLYTLLTDATMLTRSVSSAGFWSQLGHRIDKNKNDAAGLFDKKGFRDLFAIASLIPGLNGLMTRLNERMPAARDNSLPKDHYVVGGAHVDSNKYITALSGRRDNLETQILWAGNWISLPVTGDTLAIFPSAKISSLAKIPATLHRVLLWEPPDNESTAEQNITLSLSVVDRPAYSGLDPYVVVD